MTRLPALDPARIHPVYAGANALSPFHACYANPNTVLRLAAGRFFAHYNGEDITATYWALRRAAVLYDVPERPLEISGPDAVPFLDRIFTRRSGAIKIGRGRYVLACTHEGGLFMDGILFRLADDRFWFVQPDGELDSWLLAHRHGHDVTISDPHSRVLQLQGPKSLAIINAASDGAIDPAMGYFHAGFYNLGGQIVFVSRTGWSGELGYEIYTKGAATDCPRLWEWLMQCGAPHGLLFGSMQSLNIRRIEAGILDSGSDFDSAMMPAEAGLSRFVDEGNTGFIGREPVLATHRENRIFGLLCAGHVPAGGSPVRAGDEEVGIVTTGAHSPEFDAGIGYVRFASTGAWQGRDLHITSGDGARHECRIVTLPFYDPDKQLVRMARLDGDPS
jgi:aminomethyltransferase